MRKIIAILISLTSSFIIMTAGYGYWTEELTIEGDLTLKEDPKIIAELEADLSKEQSILADQNQQLSAKLDELQKLYQLASEEIQQQTTETKETTIDNETQNIVDSDNTKTDESQEEQVKEGSIEENETNEQLPAGDGTNNQETITEVPKHDTSIDDNKIGTSTDNTTNNTSNETPDNQSEQATSIEQDTIDIDNDSN